MPTLSRRRFLELTGAGGLGLALPWRLNADRDVESRPNILVIVVDDLRWDDFGAAGPRHRPNEPVVGIDPDGVACEEGQTNPYDRPREGDDVRDDEVVKVDKRDGHERGHEGEVGQEGAERLQRQRPAGGDRLAARVDTVFGRRQSGQDGQNIGGRPG